MSQFNQPTPQVIDWQGGQPYRQILDGAPGTFGMRSGRVELARGEEIGQHSTGDHEETLLVLEGTGVVHVHGREPMAVHGGQSVYIPPRSTHNVRNPDSPLLRYIYVVAPVADASNPPDHA